MISRVKASEFESEYFERALPAIVVDALESWQPAERWSPQQLAVLAGHRAVTVGVSKDGRYLYNQSTDATRMHEYQNRDIAFAEAIHNISDPQLGRTFYILQQSIPDKLPELMGQLVLPVWIHSLNPDINIWLGRDTCGPLHFDKMNNFFAQLYGTKRFVICSPKDTAYLYPYRGDAVMAQCSHVDVNSPDWVSHPQFAHASPISFELQAGELLFLPAFWWHQVQGMGLSISVNFWWPARLLQFLESPNSARSLCGWYRLDRLSEFKRTCLDPAGRDFLSVSTSLLEQGRTWGATVLGLAAFEERMARAQGTFRPGGCSFSDLAKELEAACSRVSDTLALTHHQRQLLKGVPEIAATAAHCEDTWLESATVLSLLEAVSVLETAAAAA